MKFAFYSVTRGSINNTMFYESVNRLADEVDIVYEENNTEGLSKRYNDFIKKSKNLYEYIVFVHDDVFVDDLNVCQKLIHAHRDFDIVGLAGGINPVIQKPALWHLMCGGFGSGNLRGAVAHPAGPEAIGMTSFGVTPARVAILDGLFLSLKTSSIKNKKWQFNENYKFHHYDIASCIDANQKKLKLGVAPIWVVHNSPGLLNINDKMFTNSQETFMREYSNNSI
jgi:hypothetical protein